VTFKEKLASLIRTRKTTICVGLDPDVNELPRSVAATGNPILEFNRRIIEATSDIVCAYKPNMAFFECHGSGGWETLKSTIELIPKNVPVIIDAKRGDIGNTSAMYARAIFDELGGDAITLSPYLGEDSLAPFFEYTDKFSFVLCVTSNAGARDFQFLEVDGCPLYKRVAAAVLKWNKHDNLGLVVGAPYPEKIQELRSISGDMPFLIPGVGAQGGDLETAVRYGSADGQIPVVINVSRSVLYASKESDFADKARSEVERLNGILSRIKLLA
jgi:orotidine-5'-phosphate decarboxylase